MKKLFNHTKRPDRNWEEDVQDGYDWDEEQDGGEYYADDEEYTDEELAEHGITREEAEAGRITETETPETDENGNVIQSADSQVADNPNISNPPAEKTDEEQQEGLPDNAGITREDLAAE